MTEHATAIRTVAAGHGTSTLQAVLADITALHVDVIVNAANRWLRGGGGVDGAIHRAAGPELLQACSQLGGCDPGDAKITPAFRLPARYVVHAVGPVWEGGSAGEAEQLRSCYRRSLLLADQHHAHTIAFPSISTGVFGYPPKLAAPVAIAAVIEALAECAYLQSVMFCCYSQHDLALYRQALES